MLHRLFGPSIAKATSCEERGQTMVEYGLLVGLISVALIFALSTIATQLLAFMASFTAGLSL